MDLKHSLHYWYFQCEVFGLFENKIMILSILQYIIFIIIYSNFMVFDIWD